MSHKPEDHDSWKEVKNECYGKRKKPKIDSTSPPKLSLSDKMKAALATKYKMEHNEIEDMLNDSSLKWKSPSLSGAMLGLIYNYMVPIYSVASNGPIFFSYNLDIPHKRVYSSKQMNQYMFYSNRQNYSLDSLGYSKSLSNILLPNL